MKLRLTHLTATLGGLALAATIALPVLAAPVGGAATLPAAQEPAAALDLGTARCAGDWAAVTADRTLGKVQAVGYCEIGRRLDSINRLRGIVNGTDVLTQAHASALTTILDGSASGLKNLRAEIAADTTVQAASEDVRRIFTDYRVYALVSRQVVLVRADDRVDAAADRLTRAAGQLEAAIARAKASGKDVTAAQGHLDALNAAIAAARSQVSGDAAAILALTPAGWNAGTAKPVLDAGRASISAAQSDLRTGLREARAVIAALR